MRRISDVSAAIYNKSVKFKIPEQLEIVIQKAINLFRLNRSLITACLFMISVNWYCKGVSVDKDIKSRSVKTDKDSGLPMQGVYESIRVTGDYKPRLDQIAAGGFKVVLNYSIPGSVSANMAQLLAYADYANSKGLKVIWAMKNHQWWDGTYSADSVIILVNVLKNHTATWGY